MERIAHEVDCDFLEEDWLYEAITDTYIPLLAVAERSLRDGIRATGHSLNISDSSRDAP